MLAPVLLKSTIRLILKNRLLSTIKIASLAIGIGVFLLTMLFCFAEWNHDKQHPKYERVYRYVHRVNSPEGLQSFAFTSATTGPALKERYSEVEAYTRFILAEVSIRNSTSDISFNERKFGFADDNFLTFFNFPVVNEQNSNLLLQEPLSVILTPASAVKYFGSQNPVGKTLLLNGELTLTVVGVFQNNPFNTHFDFDFLAPYSSLEVIKNHPVVSKQIPFSTQLETRGFAAFYTYLLLSPNTNPQTLIDKFPTFIEEFRGKGRSERLKPTIQSLSSIHLNSDALYEIKQNGSSRIVNVNFVTGFLVLLIACINYINLSTAEFVSRSQGVGLKKILGISRKSLLGAHLVETITLTLFGLLAGCAIALTLLPLFNSIVNRRMQFFTYETGLICLSVFIIVVVVSGIYPALQITKIPTLSAFRGGLTGRDRIFSLRNILVFFQVTVSFCLLTLSLLVYFQLDYLLTKDLGFNANRIMVINATATNPSERITLKKELIKDNHVTGVTVCSAPPSQALLSLPLMLPENLGDEERRALFFHSYIDADYAAVMGLKMTQGRFFSSLNSSDSTQYIIINESGALALGDSVMNRTLNVPKIVTAGNNKKSILGLFKDFHFASLHSEIQPMVLEYNPDRCGYFLVGFESTSLNQVVSGVEKTWKEVYPLVPFDYYFLDDGVAKYYDSEQRQKQLISGIALIAIGLASLGIFGSTLFSVQQKTREIAIRKALGSGKYELLIILFKPILMLLLLSSIVGIPLSFQSGNNWLQQYPFKIAFPLWLFLASFFMILFVVVATMLYQFLKVTKINPAHVLKQS